MATYTAASITTGTAINIQSGPQGYHLFIVIDLTTSRVLLAPIESLRPKCDISCTLAVGVHPFITHSSFIGYNHCRSEDISHIVHCLTTGVYSITHPPVSATVLSSITSGYQISKFTPRFIKAEWP